MPNADCALSPISLVIRWPKSISASPLPQQLMRRLLKSRLAVTWAIEEPAQAAALASQSGSMNLLESALTVPDSSPATVAEAIEQGIRRFNAADNAIAAVQLGAGLPRGAFERRLRQAGVRALVVSASAGNATVVRPLPFGIWEFRPHLSAPKTRNWLSIVGASARRLADSMGSSLTVASIDLARVSSASSRSWREVEQLLDQAAEAAHNGHTRIVTIADMTAELSDLHAARPQRSILRIAA
jgi:hypothetical protein